MKWGLDCIYSFKFLPLHCIIWKLDLWMSMKYTPSSCVEGYLWNNCNGIYLCTTFVHRSYNQGKRHKIFDNWIYIWLSCSRCCTVPQLCLESLLSSNLFNRVFHTYVRKTKERVSSSKMQYIYSDDVYIQTPFNEFKK
jgi:hypothetical protein